MTPPFSPLLSKCPVLCVSYFFFFLFFFTPFSLPPSVVSGFTRVVTTGCCVPFIYQEFPNFIFTSHPLPLLKVFLFFSFPAGPKENSGPPPRPPPPVSVLFTSFCNHSPITYLLMDDETSPPPPYLVLLGAPLNIFSYAPPISSLYVPSHLLTFFFLSNVAILPRHLSFPSLDCVLPPPPPPIDVSSLKVFSTSMG